MVIAGVRSRFGLGLDRDVFRGFGLHLVGFVAKKCVDSLFIYSSLLYGPWLNWSSMKRLNGGILDRVLGIVYVQQNK